MSKQIPNAVVVRLKDDDLYLFVLKYTDKIPSIANLENPVSIGKEDEYFNTINKGDISICVLIVPEEVPEGTGDERIPVKLGEALRVSIGTIGTNGEDETIEDIGGLFESNKDLFVSLIRQTTLAYIAGSLTKEEKENGNEKPVEEPTHEVVEELPRDGGN